MHKKKHSYILFRTPPDKPGGTASKPVVKPDSRQATAEDTGKQLLCRHCLQVITRASEQIVVAGAHRHTFANPRGIVFEIGCFRTAIGCGYVGLPTDEFSWFAGFTWRVAVCSACLTHLGWLFTASGDKRFNGLILDRLLEAG